MSRFRSRIRYGQEGPLLVVSELVDNLLPDIFFPTTPHILPPVGYRRGHCLVSLIKRSSTIELGFVMFTQEVERDSIGPRKGNDNDEVIADAETFFPIG